MIVEMINGNKSDNLLLAKSLLNKSATNPKMSAYQPSTSYKLLGDLYFKLTDLQNALVAYQRGLYYNPKLAVKKLIKSIEHDMKSSVWLLIMVCRLRQYSQ